MELFENRAKLPISPRDLWRLMPVILNIFQYRLSNMLWRYHI